LHADPHELFFASEDAYPENAGALGPIWAALAIVWALIFAAAILNARRR